MCEIHLRVHVARDSLRCAPGARAGRYRARGPELGRKQRLQRGARILRHGIGRKFHEEPQVLHYGRPGTGLLLEAA